MRTRSVLLTTTWTALAGAALAGCGQSDDPATATTTAAATTTPANTTTPPTGGVTLPSYWFESDFDAWIGQRWDAIDLFQFLPRPPAGIDTGTKYVVFYSRTCEHCEEMFRDDFVPNPGLAAQVTTVEIPAEKDVMTSPDAWPMPANGTEHLNLPLGPNWIIATPLAVRIVDGVIACAEEGDHHECLGLEK